MFWLHWIGKSYYSIPGFIAESRLLGITRRVSLSVMKKMAWGDIVSCIQKESGLKSGSMFMEFPITRISGVSDVAVTAIEQICHLTKVSEGGKEIERGCGEYQERATYSVSGATLKEVATVLERLKKEGVDIGKPMVGCPGKLVITVSEPYPLLKDIPFRPGFRDFDRIAFWQELLAYRRNGNGHKRLKLKGQFYLWERPDTAELDPGYIQVVQNYNKATTGILQLSLPLEKGNNHGDGVS